MGEIISHRDGALLTLQLRHAGRGNAIDAAMLAALEAAVDAIEADASLRLVLLRGTPGGAFSTGADIRAWSPMSPAAFASDWIARGNRLFRRFERLRCPTLAVLEGPCFGGGLELALCADLRLATTAARLRFPEATIGALPGWEGGPRLARLAGRGRALEACLAAREIDAATAERWGVLNAVCAPERLEAELADWVARLAAVSPRAAAEAKALIVDEPHDSAAAHAEAAARLRASRDAEIGLAAFFAKSTPVY